jgi:hypothetical protein
VVPDSASFGDTEAVSRALQSAPDLRPEAVQQAREQATSVEYPPLKTIQAISHLLALNLGRDDDQQ